MATYLIIDIKIIDEEIYAEYVDRVYDVVIQFGGHYLVRGGHITPLSGGWQPERIIVIGFPDRESLHACFNSVAYQELAHLREQSTQSKAVIVEGLP